MKHTTRRIDVRHLAGVPVRKPATVLPFPVPAVADPLRTFGECPTCKGGCENPATYDPCATCAGSGVIACTCGHCEAGMAFVRDGDVELCRQARPATRDEASTFHEAWMVANGYRAPLFVADDPHDLPF